MGILDNVLTISKCTEFDKLTVTISRATTGFNKIALPKFYIKTMVELDDHVTENLAKEKSSKKKNNNSKAMNNLKTKLKKLSKQFEEAIAAYKKVITKNCLFYLQNTTYSYNIFTGP